MSFKTANLALKKAKINYGKILKCNRFVTMALYNAFIINVFVRYGNKINLKNQNNCIIK